MTVYKRDPHLIEKYKILTNAYMDEVRRYWTRYSIFTGFQVAGIYTIIQHEEKIQPEIYLLLSIFTLSSIIIYLRGMATQIALAKTIEEFERSKFFGEFKPYTKFIENDKVKAQWINPFLSILISSSIFAYFIYKSTDKISDIFHIIAHCLSL